MEVQNYLGDGEFRRRFLSGSVKKNPPAMQVTQETPVRSLGWEDPLEKGMATLLHEKIPWTEEPGRLQSTGLPRVTHN